MGKLKEKLSESRNLSGIEKCLLLLDFSYEEYVAGNNKGYQKGFEVGSLYYVYIHCDLESRLLSAYKEYECGGMLNEYTTEIPEELIVNDDVDDFIEWLEDEIDTYLT